jgi:hypothetical protein
LPAECQTAGRTSCVYRGCTAFGTPVAALGASTKGNVILQYCGFDDSDITGIGEVNEDKFGGYCPGSLIPIVPEVELLASRPYYLLVLPWHFRRFFETNRRFAAQRLVFPLPVLDIAERDIAERSPTR